MEDAGNLHRFILDPVENAMALVNDAANAIAVIRACLANQREVSQLAQNVSNSTLVGIGSVVAEPFRAEIVDINQIKASALAQPDFRHAALGGWR